MTITHKNYPTNVQIVKVGSLSKDQMSAKFKALNLDDDCEVYVKCNKNIDF